MCWDMNARTAEQDLHVIQQLHIIPKKGCSVAVAELIQHLRVHPQPLPLPLGLPRNPGTVVLNACAERYMVGATKSRTVTTSEAKSGKCVTTKHDLVHLTAIFKLPHAGLYFI